MIQKAKDAGCWAAKFQLFTKKEAPSLPKHLYLSHGQAEMLFDAGKHEVGIEVFFTPMFDEAVEWCEQIGVNYYKIRYADNENISICNSCWKTDKPTFISVGEKYRDDWGWKEYNLIPLFCVPKYPAHIIDYIDMKDWDYFQGISDHTPDLQLYHLIGLPNIEYFEKHVKLDDNCIESAWSVTFEQLKEALK